eukprot:TRINITY_DN1129_c0_g1_i1.p1 TRINITY_DN1129_c0_g1~~TRINITY_DN1129_c0_g1_i1.p1  ORF type:complete len:662 (+),score=125.74 TRINITY_DN1129_c0_g1_i1:1543-3528(+)
MAFFKAFYSEPTIVVLLRKENLTVEELLQDDNLLQECKAHNEKLLKYLSQNSTLSALINYIQTADPQSESWKFTCLSAEVLACGLAEMYEELANSDLIQLVFKPLQESTFSSVQAALLIKVLQLLVVQQSIKVSDFVLQRPEMILQHLGIPDMPIVICKLLGALVDTSPPLATQWFDLLAERLLSVLDSETSQQNCILLLHELLQVRDLVPLVKQHLLTDVFVRKLLTTAVDDALKQNTVLFPAVCTWLATLTWDSTITAVALEQRDRLQAVLRSEIAPLQINGITLTRLGRLRLAAVQLQSSMICSSFTDHAALCIPEFVGKSVTLFFQFPFHNILHSAVTNFVQHIFANDLHCYLPVLIEEAQIVTLLVKAFQTTSPIGHRGHLVQIANSIQAAALNGTEGMKKQLTPVCQTEEWQNFVSSELAKWNKRNEHLLGGVRVETMQLPTKKVDIQSYDDTIIRDEAPAPQQTPPTPAPVEPAPVEQPTPEESPAWEDFSAPTQPVFASCVASVSTSDVGDSTVLFPSAADTGLFPPSPFDLPPEDTQPTEAPSVPAPVQDTAATEPEPVREAVKPKAKPQPKAPAKPKPKAPQDDFPLAGRTDDGLFPAYPFSQSTTQPTAPVLATPPPKPLLEATPNVVQGVGGKQPDMKKLLGDMADFWK